MKVGIVTLPLHTNYGGILQAWALQTVIERMGHESSHVFRDLLGPLILYKDMSPEEIAEDMARLVPHPLDDGLERPRLEDAPVVRVQRQRHDSDPHSVFLPLIRRMTAR